MDRRSFLKALGVGGIALAFPRLARTEDKTAMYWQDTRRLLDVVAMAATPIAINMIHDKGAYFTNDAICIDYSMAGLAFEPHEYGSMDGDIENKMVDVYADFGETSELEFLAKIGDDDVMQGTISDVNLKLPVCKVEETEDRYLIIPAAAADKERSFVLNIGERKDGDLDILGSYSELGMKDRIKINGLYRNKDDHIYVRVASNPDHYLELHGKIYPA